MKAPGDPLDRERSVFVARDGGDVDAYALHLGHLRDAALPERADAAQEGASLRARDARERLLERPRAARAHLDDDDEVTLLRDEIELQRADAQVLPEDAEAVRTEPVGGGLFGLRAP